VWAVVSAPPGPEEGSGRWAERSGVASQQGIEGATVTINEGSICITSEDDGVNTIGGSGGTEAGSFTLEG